MGTRRWELVTTNESTIITKPLLDAIVMEDGKGDGSLPNATWSDESEGVEIVCKVNDPLY